jgi:hypothetical protein
MTNHLKERITRAEMRDALLRSGYLLESHIESQLRDFSWGYVEANATYPDPESGKSREFDIYAVTARHAGPAEHDYLFGVLLIECINNPQPLAILTKEPLVRGLHHYEIKIGGLPNKMPHAERLAAAFGVSGYEGLSSLHKGRAGTQFCSFARKKTGRSEEWMALHEGSHYDSFQKLCDATDYFVDRGAIASNLGRHVNTLIYYPIVIVQGI